MKDLLGQEVAFDPNGPALSDAERKRIARRRYAIPRGYAAKPGTGPDGETCKSCHHYALRQMAGTYRKCALTKWTRGPKSDIKASSPACSKWEAPHE